MTTISTAQLLVGNNDPALSSVARVEAPGGEPAAAQACPPAQFKTTTGQIVVALLGTIAFLYFARGLVLPLFLACMGG